jgi:hypothetical protein
VMCTRFSMYMFVFYVVCMHTCMLSTHQEMCSSFYVRVSIVQYALYECLYVVCMHPHVHGHVCEGVCLHVRMYIFSRMCHVCRYA